jgi:TonB family protein
MALTKSLLWMMLLLVAVNNSTLAFQKPGGRPTPTPAPTPTTPKNQGHTATGPKVTTPRLANLTIMAPAGCRVWINEIELDNTKPTLLLNQQRVKAIYSPGTGQITLKSLKPGSYRLLARKQDFRDYTGAADVLLDRENMFSIVLTPLPARLTVSPSVSSAEVEVLNLDTGQSMGRFFQKLDQVEIVPGRYRVTTSRSGYRLSMREVTARAGESIYLEPLLEPLPTPTPTPVPTPTNIPMTFDIRRQDKFLVMHLQGSSGDAAKISGTINVTFGGPARNFVTGNFNGLPCKVELLKLDNVADASIDEAPGPENDWSSIVVRFRPRDEKKRPISFAIVWSSLADRSAPKPPSTSIPPDASSTPNIFVPAVVTRKVQPNFPRGTAISGRVLVVVSIDTTGAVTSAKAVEGPSVFRRVSEEAALKWKFQPATRDGRSVASEQTIEFKFEH